MRVVIIASAFGAALGATEAAEAIATGWREAAPEDELTVLTPALPPSAADLTAALDGAGLALAGTAEFDWQTLRESLVTAVAGAAVERGVPCVVLAGRVSVGRREAAAVGVDAAYAVSAPISTAALATLAKRVAHRWSR
jgi:glycerate kinase